MSYPTRYAEEDPDVDHEGESKDKSNVKKHVRTEACFLTRCGIHRTV